MVTDNDAYRQFQKAQVSKDPTVIYDPDKSTTILLPEHDIQIRLKVLAAFQLYVQNVVAITSGTDSPALQAASKSIGDSLTGLGNDVASSMGISASTSTTYNSNAVNNTTGAVSNTTYTTTNSAPVITPAERNAAATATEALGQFLVASKIKKELPGKIAAMDPVVRQLCELLEKDIDIVQTLDSRNYDSLVNDETLFITTATLSDDVRRAEIMKLPAIIRARRTSDAQLKTLRNSILALYMAHHALAAVAAGNNPAAFKQQVGQLAAAGSNLGTFYSSLPSK